MDRGSNLRLVATGILATIDKGSNYLVIIIYMCVGFSSNMILEGVTSRGVRSRGDLLISYLYSPYTSGGSWSPAPSRGDL